MSSESYIIQDQYAVHFMTFTVVDWSAIAIRRYLHPSKL